MNLNEYMVETMRKAEALIDKYKGQKPCTVEGEDAFLIAFAAGEVTELDGPEIIDGRYIFKMKTSSPLGVFWDGKKFSIYKNLKLTGE